MNEISHIDETKKNGRIKKTTKLKLSTCKYIHISTVKPHNHETILLYNIS